MLSALADRTYRRLFTAQVISLAGTGLTTGALGLLAYDLAGADAGLVLGTVFAIKMAAYVAVAPVAAAVVHAASPRVVLVTADVVRVVVVLGLPLVSDVWQIYVLVLVLQAASAVHTPTYQATLPRVLPDEREYTEALSLSRLSEDLEMVLSPLLAAALLLLVPSSQLFVGTAAGFAISAVLVSRIALRRAPLEVDVEAQSFAVRVRRGMELMVRTPALRAVLVLNLAVAAGGAYALVQYVVIARTVFERGEGTAAVLIACLGALHGRELSVGAIAQELDRPVPAVSQHLAKLRAGHLVHTRRDGVTVYYRHANEHVDALVRNVLHQAEHLRYDHPPHHT